MKMLIAARAGFMVSNYARQFAQSLTENYEICVLAVLNSTRNLINLGPVSDLDRVHYFKIPKKNSVAVDFLNPKTASLSRDSPKVAFGVGLKETVTRYEHFKHWWEPLLSNTGAVK